MGYSDTEFSFDKYLEPTLTDRKTAIANAVVNACFMVPGNDPTNPLAGVNIKQYFYKEEAALSADKIKADLETTCGKIINGATIANVSFSTEKLVSGDTVFLLILRVKFNADDEELLGIAMKETANNYVSFNFDYAPID